MSNLLRAELLKLRTTRTFAALVGSALALSLLVVVLTAALSSDQRHDPRRADRVQLTAAKMLAYAVAGVVLSLIVTVSIMAVGSAVLSGRGETTIGVVDLADVLWRNLLVAALLGAFGVALGGLVRNQIAAIIVVLIFSFALEPSLIGLAVDVGKFGPTVGAPNGILGINPIGDDALLPAGIAALVLLGWVALGFAATAALLRRRDLV